MSWQETIIAAHAAVTEHVSHLKRMKSRRYFVWQEDGANDLTADNMHGERTVTGSTDLFTSVDFDPWAQALEQSFDAHGIAWSLRDIQYEDETGIIHYTWDWEVPYG